MNNAASMPQPIICGGGTAPAQAVEGYRIIDTIIGTDAEVLAAYEGSDVRLVRGGFIHGLPDACEFAVMAKPNWSKDVRAHRSIMNPPHIIPKLKDCESPKLVAMTTSYGLHVVKVTHYDDYDDESTPWWSTACRDGWKLEPAEILWWAYADDVRNLVESGSQLPLSCFSSVQTSSLPLNSAN